jgi:hypothetical protein
MYPSRLGLIFSLFLLTAITWLYYPKYLKSTTEATISWDVSGYYWYLPAFFIYQDPRNCSYAPEVFEKYRPTPDFQQAFKAPNGKYVFKYSIGQALNFLPGFLLGHSLARISDYPDDGFSKPYQFGIFFWSWLVMVIGVYFLYLILRRYFSEATVCILLIGITLGTHYLEYGAITHAMTHNYLFTYYTLLIWAVIRFYNKPRFDIAVAIGAILGMMALTRPTEILAVMIPVLWGLKPQLSAIQDRINFLFRQWEKVTLAILCMAGIGALQLLYWKFSSGSWIVYSYEDQGFSWLHPHLYDCLFSAKAGWWVYTPLMFFASLGFLPMWHNKFESSMLFSLFCGLFVYVTFAWDIWWYGGSLGQRGLIQIYPILAFPLGYMIQYVIHKNWIVQLLGTALLGLIVTHNFWLTHHAHLGGLIKVGEMTAPYFRAILMRDSLPDQGLKLLDVSHTSPTVMKDATLLIPTKRVVDTFCLNTTTQFSPVISYTLSDGKPWLRAESTVHLISKEWESWKMTQMQLKFYNDLTVISSQGLRLQRHLEHGQTGKVFFDALIPSGANRAELSFWHADSSTDICISNCSVSTHR